MNEILTTIIQVIIIPLITILASFLVKFIKAKSDELIAKTNNELANSYIKEASEAVSQAVSYVTQTYVDSLKKQGKFDMDAQKRAFESAKDVALQLLTKEARDMIEMIYGDVSLWLDTKIEQTVNEKTMLLPEIITTT